jgi:hypothetical protein
MSIVTHLAVHFALHPEAELTAAEIGERWKVVPHNVHATLAYAASKGWVASTLRANSTAGRKNIRVYSAGPRLLKEIGR